MIDLQVHNQYDKWMAKPLQEVLTDERKEKAKHYLQLRLQNLLMLINI